MVKHLEYIYVLFGDKRNTTGGLLWLHAVDTMMILRGVLKKSQEDKNILELSLVALGHDLLEDTDVTADEIGEMWGMRVMKGIMGLTKMEADKGDQSQYIKKLSTQSEEMWLVKLADIVSNVSNSIAVRDSISLDWCTDFWFPLLKLYQSWYSKIVWVNFPKSGKKLVEMCDRAITKLIISKEGGV